MARQLSYGALTNSWSGRGKKSLQSIFQASLSTLGHDENVFLRANFTISNYVNSMDYSIHFLSSTIAILSTIIQ